MYFYNGLHRLYGFLVYDYFFEKNFFEVGKMDRNALRSMINDFSLGSKMGSENGSKFAALMEVKKDDCHAGVSSLASHSSCA